MSNPFPSLTKWIQSAVDNNKHLPTSSELALWAKVPIEVAEDAIKQYQEKNMPPEPVKGQEPEEEKDSFPLVYAAGWVLLILGTFLEGYYYFFRFTSDGTADWIAIISAISLCLFLTVSVHLENTDGAKGKHLWGYLAVFLVAFSVVNTAAGQTFSLLQADYVQSDASSAPKIAELDRDIARLEKKQDENDGKISSTVKTLEDQFTWKNTYSSAKSDEQALQDELTAKREERNKLRDQVSTKKAQSVYEFYVHLFSFWGATSVITFAFHVIMSLLIALMAPVGITMIDNQIKAESLQRRTRLE